MASLGSAKHHARHWADALRRSDKADWDDISDRMMRKITARNSQRALQTVHQNMEGMLLEAPRMEITITSARPLTDSVQQQLIKQLFGSQPVLVQTAVDPSLIGGAVIQSPNELWDLSVKHQLDRLKRSIVES